MSSAVEQRYEQEDISIITDTYMPSCPVSEPPPRFVWKQLLSVITFAARLAYITSSAQALETNKRSKK